jgi:hypothetical protein
MLKRFADWLIARAQRRSPDFVIGGDERPYLLRWWVIPRNKVFNVYLHLFLRSDDDRALHDHPWANASMLLRGATSSTPSRRAASSIGASCERAISAFGSRVASRIASSSRAARAGRCS